ncbi:aspartyl/glutamyl-tRNA amidotransferase subunit C [Candidatus Riflebacteria bacterium]
MSKIDELKDTKEKEFDLDLFGNLARINLTEEQKVRFSKQLGDILHYFSKIASFSENDEATCAHKKSFSLNENCELKEDSKLPGLERVSASQKSQEQKRDQLLSAAPMRDGNYFLVPRVLD